MNELFVYLETMRGTALLVLGVTALVATGLAIFSRRAQRPAAEQNTPEQARKAA